jgi:OOP family OmpA-OmpF porin
MSSKSMLVALAVAAAVVAAPAAAQSNFYIAGSAGHSTISANGTDVDAMNLRNGFTSSSTAVNNNDTGAKFDIGYRLSPTFALEFGYAYLGKATFTSSTNVSAITGQVKGELVNLDVVGLWPISQNFGFLARLGIYRWTAKSDIPALSGGTTATTDHGWDFKAGAGLQYDINRNFALRAEYERYNGIGDNMKTGDSKVNLLSAGAVLKF